MARFKNKNTWFWGLVFLIALSMPVYAREFIVATQPLKGSVYTVQEALAILRGKGLIADQMTGQGVIDLCELRRLIDQAEENRLKQLVSDNGLVDLLDRAFPEASCKGRRWNETAIEEANLGAEYFYTNSEKRHFRGHDGRGVFTTQAFLDPMTSYRSGALLNSGHNVRASGRLGLGVGNWLGTHLEPDLLLRSRDPDGDNLVSVIQQVAASLFYGNLNVRIGRIPIIWGSGQGHSFILSNNARPMDSIQIGSASPFYLPWVFRHIGRLRMSMFLSRLENKRTIPSPYVLGARLEFLPLDWLELGFSHNFIFGGKGGPDWEWYELPLEMVGIRPRGGFIFNIKYTDKPDDPHRNGIANNVFSIDWRVKTSVLRNTEFYGEYFDDDLITHDRIWEYNAGFRLGVWIPRVTDDGRLSFNLEGLHSGKRVGLHYVWQSGYSYYGRQLGNELGQSAWGGNVGTSYLLNKQWLSKIGYAFEMRSRLNSQSEIRNRIVIENRVAFEPHSLICLEWGYENVDNFAFSAASRDQFMAGLKWQYSF